jgi:hypothetical protein
MSDSTFEEIRNLKTLGEIYELIEGKYPGWIMDALDNYSLDYPQLQKNWKIISDLSKNPMQKIIIVKNFENDEQHTYAELLSSMGFIVRTQYELYPCSVCKSAIPSENTYIKMKEHGINVPEKWQKKCVRC